MKKLAALFLSGTLACTLSSPITVLAEEPDEANTGLIINQNDTAEKSEDIYRLYNLFTGEHLYTASEVERDQCIRDGWMYEGLGWIGALEGDPVYRVYNPNAKGGDHYYTKNHEEASYLVSLGWKWDFDGDPVFFSAGSDPLYVAWNPNAESGTHNYTTNRNEQDALLKAGWKNDAIAWYVLSGPEKKEPSSTPLDVIAELGAMDRAPLPFRNLGWIIFQNGKIGYVDQNGQIVAQPKYEKMCFDYYPGSEEQVFLFENTDPDCPFIKLPSNVYDSSIARPGGLGGALTDTVTCFDPASGAIVQSSTKNSAVYQQITEWSNACKDLLAVSPYPYNTDEFYLWNSRKGDVFGPIASNSLYTFPVLGAYIDGSYFDRRSYGDIIPHSLYNNSLVGNLAGMDVGKGGYQRRYIYNYETNEAAVGFERLTYNGLYGISGTMGQSTFVYDRNLNLIFAGDFEDASAPIGDRAMVKTDRTWKVVTLESAKAQIPAIPFTPIIVDHYYKESTAQKFD